MESILTQFKLTEDERDFLKVKGKGSLKSGLEEVMREAGFVSRDIQNPTGLTVIRNYEFNKEQYRYMLIENEKEILSLSIGVMIEQSFKQRYGMRCFYEDVILKGLLPMPSQEPIRESIKKIVDSVGGTELWARKVEG